MSRQEANKELLNQLEYLIERYPDQRFSQILCNYGFVKAHRPVRDPDRIDWQNEFNLESDTLIERVKRRIKDLEDDI